MSDPPRVCNGPGPCGYSARSAAVANWDAALGRYKDVEHCTELRFLPCGAWDFPLSRGEKVRRLILCFEAETRSSEQEIAVLSHENEALRARAQTAEVVAELPLAGATSWQRSSSPPPCLGWPSPPLTEAQQTGPHVVSPLGSPAASPRAFVPPAPAAPRSRRRTTIFATRDSDMVVRIPRRTAPAAATTPHVVAPLPARKSACWETFADGSDDEVLTPRSGCSSACSVPSSHLGAGERDTGRRLSLQPTPLTTPDGIQIVVTDTCGTTDSAWHGLMENKWESSHL
mmetsp:Transcript_136997/g.381948  ORF Transcript_136997/g.381948 Transcript_136997/m.381948 type:complete len:286 (-) Transcript_136997:298-1155(-)